MLLIVTRPRNQAAAWVAGLRALGQAAQALPLIAIVPAADAAPLRSAWHRIEGYALVVFVSANAVEHFAAHAPQPGHWPPGVDAGSTGPGTSAALRAAGVPIARIAEPPHGAPSFDSEALWAQLQARPWSGRRVLVVRGEDGRDWLADTLRARGAIVEFVAAYARRTPRLDAAEQALLDGALALPAQHLWHFSSSEAVGHLQLLVPAADWSASNAVASHPRIAEAVRAAGFGSVALAPPKLADVAQLAASWPQTPARA